MRYLDIGPRIGASVLWWNIFIARACIAATGMSNTEPVSFKADVQPVLNTYCVACHQYGASQAGLNLEQGEAWFNLVNISSTQSTLVRVRPGELKQSYLVHKLLGTHVSVGGVGARMPLSGGIVGTSLISAEEIDLIQSWVLQGAKNN